MADAERSWSHLWTKEQKRLDKLKQLKHPTPAEKLKIKEQQIRLQEIKDSYKDDIERSINRIKKQYLKVHPMLKEYLEQNRSSKNSDKNIDTSKIRQDIKKVEDAAAKIYEQFEALKKQYKLNPSKKEQLDKQWNTLVPKKNKLVEKWKTLNKQLKQGS